MTATLAFACAMALTACAQTSAIPLAPGDATTPGIRIYDSKPLLMVYDKGAEITFIPNYNRAYALQFTAFLAKNDVKTEYDSSTLKKLDTNLDSTDFIKLLTTIASGLLGQGAATTPKTSAGLTGAGALRAMYDFEFDDAGDFVRLRRLDTGFPRPYPEPASVPPPAAAAGGAGGRPVTGGGPTVGNRS